MFISKSFEFQNSLLIDWIGYYLEKSYISNSTKNVASNLDFFSLIIQNLVYIANARCPL